MFVSGQAGLDPATGQAAGADFETQARQAFANLAVALEDAGSHLRRVVKVTCFVAEPAGFAILNELVAELWPEAPPARSAPIVTLPRGLLFSVEAIAVAAR